MKLGTFLSISGVIAIVFGVAFVAVPAQMLSLYGITPNAATILMSRFFGATLLDVGLVIFLARMVTDPTAQRAIVVGSLVGSLVGLCVAVYGQLSGIVNSLGWSSVVIYLLLTVGYAYFVYAKDVEPQPG
jgi:Ca2+/Na+ antiporter